MKKNERVLRVFLLLMTAFLVVSCGGGSGGTNTSATDERIPQTLVFEEEGDTVITLPLTDSVSVSARGQVNDIVYTSSDPQIADVDQNDGSIFVKTANGGEFTIIASSEGDAQYQPATVEKKVVIMASSEQKKDLLRIFFGNTDVDIYEKNKDGIFNSSSGKFEETASSSNYELNVAQGHFKHFRYVSRGYGDYVDRLGEGIFYGNLNGQKLTGQATLKFSETSPSLYAEGFSSDSHNASSGLVGMSVPILSLVDYGTHEMTIGNVEYYVDRNVYGTFTFSNGDPHGVSQGDRATGCDEYVYTSKLTGRGSESVVCDNYGIVYHFNDL